MDFAKVKQYCYGPTDNIEKDDESGLTVSFSAYYCQYLVHHSANWQ